MQLKDDVLKKINTPGVRLKLAFALEVTEQTIIRYITNNDEKLTLAASMAVIREETGLKDSQILEKRNVAA
jgi:adenosine/AMP kinase